MLQCGPGILHPDVPEGHGVSPTALSLPSHVEHRAARPVVPLRDRELGAEWSTSMSRTVPSNYFASNLMP